MLLRTSKRRGRGRGRGHCFIVGGRRRSDLAGEGEAVGGELVEAADGGLQAGDPGDGLVLLRGAGLQEGADHPAVLDPVGAELGCRGGRVAVPEQHRLPHVVPVELPRQVERPRVEVGEIVVLLHRSHALARLDRLPHRNKNMHGIT